MISLEKASGLPIEMREDYSLVFGEGIKVLEPVRREFGTIRNFFQNAPGGNSRKSIYYIYEDTCLLEHEQAIRASGLKYSLTVIPPGKIGGEFVKTVGNFNSLKEGTTVRFPAVFEIIYGKVFFLLQTVPLDSTRPGKVYAIEASRSEKIVAPPGFGVTIINPSEDVVVFAEWGATANQKISEPYEGKNGAAYYLVESQRLSGDGKTTIGESEFAPNLNYDFLPPLERASSRELPRYDLLSAIPMYFSAIRNLKLLDFLVNPEKYLDELVAERLFK